VPRRVTGAPCLVVDQGRRLATAWHLVIPGANPTNPESTEVWAVPTAKGLPLNAVRRWAAEQGIEVAKRGRLAKNVLDAFLKAN
jgi:hypothetical protein